MIRINCPYCGLRDQTEFNYGGDGTVTRPSEDASLAAWTDFVYMQDNPRGVRADSGTTAGCRQWLKVVRDTVTHEVIAVGTVDEDVAAKVREREAWQALPSPTGCRPAA